MSQPAWPEEGGRPEHTDRSGQRPPDDWNEQPPRPPSGMSGGMKACLVVICVVGLCCLLCCGAFGYLGYSMVPKMSSAPGDVNAALNQIAQMTLPPGLEPKDTGKSDNFMFSMVFVFYQNPGHARLMMGQFATKLGGGANDMQKGMRQQFDMRRNVEFHPMVNEKSETKNIKIKGKDYPFVIASGEEETVKVVPAGGNNKAPKKVENKAPEKVERHHRISGEFDGKGGMAVIVIDFDDTYKEADFIKMLETIQ
jgi:hypothetical protein